MKKFTPLHPRHGRLLLGATAAILLGACGLVADAALALQLDQAGGHVAVEALQQVAAAFVGLMIEAGVPVRFQVGEPWWWIAEPAPPNESARPGWSTATRWT